MSARYEPHSMNAREELQEIIELAEAKWPTLREEEERQQYRHAIIGGGVGGALLGKTLHSRGVLPGAAVGAVVGGLARKALAKRVDALEDSKLPVDAGIVGRIPGVLAVVGGAAALANRDKLGKSAKEMGAKYRAWRAAKNPLKKMKPEDYVNIAPEKPVALLERYALSSGGSFISFEEAPKGPHGLNPFKWNRQQKEVERWVRKKEDENPAGVSYKDVQKKYKPVDGIGKMAVGGLVGGLAASVGALGVASALEKKSAIARAILRDPRMTLSAAASAGAGAGAYAANRKGVNDLVYRQRTGLQTLQDEAEQNRVDVKTLKASAPIASSHMEVAGALKGQGVGFFRRHAMGLATLPIRHSRLNAAFVPAGPKGVIVSPKQASPLTIRHEDGHAKDYAHYGGERGWRHVYGQGDDTPAFDGRDPYLHKTMLPEERAWSHAKPRTKREREVSRAALDTYASSGFLRQMSARDVLEAIKFGYTEDFLTAAASGAGTVAGIGGAYAAHSAIQRKGGYGQVANNAMRKAKEMAQATKVRAAKIAASRKARIGAGIGAAALGAGALYGALRRKDDTFEMSAREELSFIMNSASEKLIELRRRESAGMSAQK